MSERSGVRKLDLGVWIGFGLIAISAIIVAVCLPEISRTFNTNLAENGGIETARSAVILVVILLAGMVSQRWGKKRFLALGQYFIAAGFFLAGVSQNYPMLILAVMMMGVGGGFSEALLNPLTVDIHPRESGRYLNLSHAFYPVSIMGSALLFGELLTRGVSWRTIFQIAGLAALIVAVYTSLLRFPKEKRDGTAYGKLFASVLKLGGFWLFAAAMFLGGSIESALTFWSRSYVEIYLSDVPRSGAIAVVIFAASMAVGRFLTAYLANRFSLNSIMLASAVLGIGVTILIPLAAALTLFYLLVALAGLAIACFWPTILAEADNHLPVNSTILMVLLACAGIIGHGLTPWIMGVIGDSRELRAGFVVIPLLFFIMVIVLLVERGWQKIQRSSVY